MFIDRVDAGNQLADKLQRYIRSGPHIFALARGGIPVAYQVAEKLQSPLDAIVVRKLGVPAYPELGFGAIAPEGIILLDQGLIQSLNITKEEVESVIVQEQLELERRISEYQHGSINVPDLTNKTAILIDDGIATGITASAAIRFIKKHKPTQVILAVPVCAKDSMRRLKSEVTDAVCLHQPAFFNAVGEWYRNFDEVSDTEVINLLDRARQFRSKVN